MKVKVTYPIYVWDCEKRCSVETFVEKTLEIPEALYCQIAQDRDFVGQFIQTIDNDFWHYSNSNGLRETDYSMIPLSL